MFDHWRWALHEEADLRGAQVVAIEVGAELAELADHHHLPG